MEKPESGYLKWWGEYVVQNPRGAIFANCGLVIMSLGVVTKTLYDDKNESYQALIRCKDACSQEKLDIIYGAIAKQEELNERYRKKEEDLQELNKKVNEVLQELKKGRK